MITMEILCAESFNGSKRVPPVGKCECGIALELEHENNRCTRCGFTWSKTGELVGVPPGHVYEKVKAS